MEGDGKESAQAALLRVRDLRSRIAGPFSFDLPDGECLAVLGPSGCGKTSLLRMLADLDENSGTVMLEGRERESWEAPAWRRQVAYHAAEAAWWQVRVDSHFSAGSLEFMREEVTDWMAALRLPKDLLSAEVGRLSTGERQRLALVRTLVRTLARAPAILLLDEPTASLDQQSVAGVEQVLRYWLRPGRGMVIVTHSEDQAGRMAGATLRLGGNAAGRHASG
ncbi:ABC transporter ATP-binding protein [Noviherbaspirillum galbum]|uniref:ATP-binding cassette domain-containing protein n=1 Tax=Noviherbaspirillum galbum TaxID=2709383 RepID=A0A6B3SGH5_9BURK|nr:ATP-binding cassette domain-containing protein [Noviherbaspirillum galbum]NEX59964.1 ATP-binding cassette domain-containing protein [Noviherbaspirillum galbum]